MARIVFLGTPAFAVPTLQACIKHHTVVGVVTQPDRHAGRGRKRVVMPPVKELALEHDIPVLQPARLRRDKDTVDALRELNADVFALAAYGQILRRDVLEIPPHGVIGVHASLLPRWRGSSPISAAILHGDAETGISLMLTDVGMDTGDVIAQRSLPIGAAETTATLTDKLAHLGAELLVETLPAWLSGEITPAPQDDALATAAGMIDKSEGEIDWTQPAAQIDRKIRAYTPWPGTYCHCDGKRFRIVEAHLGEDICCQAPGTVIAGEDGISVVTGDGVLVLDKVQLAGKKPMPAATFARGRQGFVSSVLD